MSGELKASEEWIASGPVPESRKQRKEKVPPVTRRQFLLAGLKRITVVFTIVAVGIAVAAMLVVHFSNTPASRAFPLAFLAAGGFIALGGFLGVTTGPSYDWMPERGYDSTDKAQAMNNSIVFGAFGVALIVAGVVLDAFL